MPKPTQASVFIWYHANGHQETTFQGWLSSVQQQLNIKGKLYKREQNEKTTFMEVFEHVDSAMIEKIEQLATQHLCFNGIHRQCESFERITTP